MMAALANASELPEFKEPEISTSEWQDLRTAVGSLADVRCSDDAKNSVYVCSSDGRKAVWIFTTPAHPAHPAVVLREVLRGSDKIRVRSRGYFAGPEPAFAEWFAAFAELDR